MALREDQFLALFRKLISAENLADVAGPANAGLFEKLISDIYMAAADPSGLGPSEDVALAEKGDALHINEVDLGDIEKGLEKNTDSTRAASKEKATVVSANADPDGSKASLAQSLRDWGSKFQGAGKPPPAGASFRESVVTFFGVFFTLLLLSGLSELVKDWSNDQYFLLLANFGATMTLIFDIHKAPAAQPRNLILGSTAAASVAILLCYVPETILPVWVRVAVAPALAIACMGKLGISHPPAGAAALIYAQGGAAVKELGWMYLLLPLFVGNITSISMAVLVNNISKERQYPTYWALLARTW